MVTRFGSSSQFTPASGVSRALSKAGFGKYSVILRGSVANSGYRCSWDKDLGGRTRVSWRPGDDVHERDVEAVRTGMLDDYETALRAVGYTVERTGGALYVPPKS